MEDVTPLFESYHALADTPAIRRSLAAFEWKGKVDPFSRHMLRCIEEAGAQGLRVSSRYTRTRVGLSVLHEFMSRVSSSLDGDSSDGC